MLKRGDAIQMTMPTLSIAHLWIIITEPSQDSGTAVIVNVTTRRAHSDATVILKASDHPYVRHESVIMFSDAQIFDTKIIEKEINDRNPNVTIHHCCSNALLKKIQQGLLASPMTPNKVLNYCKKSWNLP